MFTERDSKICLSAIVYNQSSTILKMLESCYQYIDYWIIQDGVSTDGTKEIIMDFFNSKNIPGFLYGIELGDYHKAKSHLISMCYNYSHGCDWILEMNPDEILSVGSDFNWSLLKNKEYKCFSTKSNLNGSVYSKICIRNPRLKWFINSNGYIECLENSENNNPDIFLPDSFRYIISSPGKDWIRLGEISENFEFIGTGTYEDKSHKISEEIQKIHNEDKVLILDSAVGPSIKKTK
jgi:hypothetical protein